MIVPADFENLENLKGYFEIEKADVYADAEGVDNLVSHVNTVDFIDKGTNERIYFDSDVIILVRIFVDFDITQELPYKLVEYDEKENKFKLIENNIYLFLSLHFYKTCLFRKKL